MGDVEELAVEVFVGQDLQVFQIQLVIADGKFYFQVVVNYNHLFGMVAEQ